MSLLLPAQKLAKCEETLDVSFQNKRLCLQALQMNVEPVLFDGQLELIGKNDRLAVLGNNMMRAYFCKQWFYSNQSKGESRKRFERNQAEVEIALWSLAEQNILKATNLAKVGTKKGLDACVLKSNNQNVSPNMMATTIQALVGAVYVEEGETGMAKLLERLGLKLEYLNNTEAV